MWETYRAGSVDEIIKKLEIAEGEEYHIRVRRISEAEFKLCSLSAKDIRDADNLVRDVICVEVDGKYFKIYV